MALYLYCIAPAGHPAPPPDLAGVGRAPVQARDVAGLVAWVSVMDAAPAPSLAAAREHNAVVESACAERTALPVRFGQWFPGETELEASIAGRRDHLAATLHRVDGAMEMGIRITDPAHEEVTPDRSTGRAYLETLARRDARGRAARARGEAVARELIDWIGPLARETRVRALGSTGGLAAVACLVARHDIGDYLARAREFPARHEDLRFHFSGPWPPYGFADDATG